MELNFTDNGWRDLTGQLHWIASFNKWLRLSQLPRLRGDTLCIASDYSGEHRGSTYEVISVLIADLDGMGGWQSERLSIRRRFLRDGRRMAFKKLNDRQRQQALVPFLTAANAINGLCLVVGIHKAIQSLVTNEPFHQTLRESGILQAEWRFEAFERMTRIAHFVALLIGGLASPGQNIYWISDEDEILGGSKRSEDTRRLLSTFTSLYVPFKLGELGIGTTAWDEGDFLEEDLAAVPDLVAGATAELLSTIRRAIGKSLATPVSIPVPSQLSSKSNLLIEWLEDNTYPLKRVRLVFDSHGDARYSLGPFRTEADASAPFIYFA